MSWPVSYTHLAALDAARTRLDAAEAARETILLQHIANGVIIDSRTVDTLQHMRDILKDERERGA